MDQIMVSVICLAYNHEKYIRQCLDGFVMQKTSFRYEVLIHDDASTDHTADIIREYEANYPDLIKPVYQTENQYSKHVGITKTFLMPIARGKYIALCEGDDYWTDPLKLQKQVAYLECHPETSACFHRADILCEGNFSKSLYSGLEERDYTEKEILYKWTIPTASFMYRAEYYNRVPYDQRFWAGDIILFLTMAECGAIHCLPDKMCVYRRHNDSVVGKMIKDGPTLKKLRIEDRHYQAIGEYFEGVSPKMIKRMRLNLRIVMVKTFLSRRFPWMVALKRKIKHGQTA